jgi:hypothetical protein
MNYKEVKHRVLKNIGKAGKEDAEFLRNLHIDIQDSIVSLYSRVRAPRKLFTTYLNGTVDISEDFADTTYVDGLSFSGDFVKDTNRLQIEDGQSGVITVTGLESINTVSISLEKETFITAYEPTGTIKVLAGDGTTELFSEDFEFTDPTTQVVTVSPGIERSDVILQISLTDPSTSYQYVYVNQVTINSNHNKIDMPSDFFLPLEVRFYTDDYDYHSIEIPYEAFRRWRLSAEYPTITELINSNDPYISQIFLTQENLLYDGSIGYAFDVKENKAQLVWKPKVACVLEITYTPIITPSIADANSVNINRAYIDTLVADVSIRQLTPRLAQADSEVKLLGLRDLIREFKIVRDEGLKDFIKYTESKSQTDSILAQPFINDQNMFVSYQ